MQLGPYMLSSPWILAPMAGVSEKPFRLIARKMGAAAAPTELISAKGLLFGQERTERYLRHDPTEQPFWVQLFGAEPDLMAAAAARACELGADVVDINMGCPVRKVTQTGAGAALHKDIPRAAALVAAVVKQVGVPVTAKIRAGWDAHTVNATELASALENEGCCAVAVHARTRAQGYRGRADWKVIEEVVESCSITVIGNGDVWVPDDARRMMATTSAAGVMIGRGAMGNPWIFRGLTNPEAPPPTPQERYEVIFEHLKAHIEHVGDEVAAVRSFRQHLMSYVHGLPHATGFRRQVMTVNRFEPLMAASRAFLCRDGDSP